MAGQRFFFFLVVLTLAGLPGAHAEPTAPPSLKAEEAAPESRQPKRDSADRTKRNPDGKKLHGPDDRDKRGGDDDADVPKKFRERFKNLSPEGQERFRQNWARWRGMDPEEREELMDRGLQERQRAEELIDAALRESGLDLTRDEREVFALRYRQERRKLEEGLRDEIAKLREQRLDAMLDRLKNEFAEKVE